MTDTLYLIVSVDGQRIALPTGQVESVVEVDAVTPVPRVASHVAGLFALRSRVLTVIDAATALGLRVPHFVPGMPAVIVNADGHPYAVLVDEVHDVVMSGRPAPAPARLEGGWAAATQGLIEEGGDAFLLVDPAWLVSPLAPASC
ncbi:MAG: chemotaxis protein CheW [Sphingomonas fennica]